MIFRKPASQPDSISRSSISPAEMESLADVMLRSSLGASSAPSASLPSSSATVRASALAGTPPPPYSSSSSTVVGPIASSILPAEQRRVDEIKRDNTRKREDEATLSAAEAELRLFYLRYDTGNACAGAAAHAPSTAGLFKTTCSTDLLFLVDTTSSMRRHIDAAKKQVIAIMDDIRAAFFNEPVVRMAVVGYKDHGYKPHIQFLDFTTDADNVKEFLKTLVAKGGGDIPEDVLGGLQQAINASWKHPTRCIIHIADAPPHGRDLHDLDDEEDKFPEPGSEPHGLTHRSLLKQAIGLNINYALLRINHSTDRMSYTFFKSYAAVSPDCRLHESNAYYSKAARILSGSNAGFHGWAVANRRARSSLRFEELNLGTSFDSLRHMVVKIVTTSATRSATLSTLTGSTNKPRRPPTLHSALPSVKEELSEPADDSEVVLDTAPPRWDDPAWLDEVRECAAYSTDVVAHSTSMLDQMMADDDDIAISTTNLTIHKRSLPFAQGAMRVAAYARSAASRNRLVVKSSKRQGKKLAHLADEMRCQALCKAFALEFNAMLPEKYSLDFIVVTCLVPMSGARKHKEFMSLEPLIDGDYVKYNSNAGWVNERDAPEDITRAAQAFSHFTFERSRGRFLVSDLQGVGHVLTDPAIHTRSSRRFPLMDTNLHADGFKFFFATHKCNRVCQRLGLKSNAAMVMTGKYKFRDGWPKEFDVANMRVCCSNKLCSKIVRMAVAKTSDEFPSYRWCDQCWPELRYSTVKMVCTAPGPVHEFSVSRFFYESQGQILPRLCPEHSGKTAGDTTGSVPSDSSP